MPSPARSSRPLALVTGASIRIGRAIALGLAEAGYDLVLHSRRGGARQQEAAALVAARGAGVHLVQGELADAAEVARLMPACAAFGTVELLVNNASEFQPDSVGDLDPALWERHFAANLRAPVFLAEAFAAQLPPGRPGAIVNLVDQRVLRPGPTYFSYSLAKQGLWAATRMLAQALAPQVRVNAVGPGPTLANDRQSPEDFSRQGAIMPLGHGASPEEIADAVLFLARAPSITGQMLAVDGGQHIEWRTLDTAVPD